MSSVSTPLTYLNDQVVKKVCVVNRLDQANLSEQEIMNTLRAVQDGLKNEFMKYFGFSAKLYYCPKNVKEPLGFWNMFLLDSSDQAGALGYHDTNDQGLPQGKIFVKTTQDYGAHWSITLDHEIKEALADPWGQDSYFQDTDTMKRLIAWEVGDPVEADKYGYQRNNIWLSNFVTPYWKHPFNDTAELDNNIRYDLMGQLKNSFEVSPGCHVSYYYISGGPNGQNGWIDQNFRGAGASSTEKVKPLEKFSELYELGDEMNVYSYAIQGNWHICFKTPTQDMVDKHGIDKQEVKDAIHAAFNPAPGSRRDIRFKMTTGGVKSLIVNKVKDIFTNKEKVEAIDESFNEFINKE